MDIKDKQLISFFGAGFFVISIIMYFLYLNQFHQIHCGNYKEKRKRRKWREDQDKKKLKWKEEKIKESKEQIEKLREEFKKNPSKFYNFKDNSDKIEEIPSDDELT